MSTTRSRATHDGFTAPQAGEQPMRGRSDGRGARAGMSGSAMNEAVGLAVIGAGPAGMAAAIAAREHGTDALVLDEQPAPGGQIYRNVEAVVAGRPDAARVLGGDYVAGAVLVRAFRNCGAEYSPRTSVWEVSTVARREDAGAPLELGVLRDGVAEIVRAHCVIVAAGAQERAVPVRGATLPGVMGAGGAQSLLKGSGLVPDMPVVLAGSGPLVYLVAWQLVRAGAPLRAVLLTMPAGWMSAGGRHPAGSARGARCACSRASAGGARSQAAWSRRSCTSAHDLAIEGRESGRVGAVHGTVAGNAVHAGLARAPARGCHPQRASHPRGANWTTCGTPRQHAFRPAVDEWGSHKRRPGCWLRGTARRILGAEAAVETGSGSRRLRRRIVSGGVRAHQRDALARPHRASIARHRRFREFLDLRRSSPGTAVRRPSNPAVTVCRCEEVTVAEIEARRMATGMPGPRSGQGVHPLRHGTVPGPDVRDRGERDLRGAPPRRCRGDRALPHPPSCQAPHRGRVGGAGGNRLRTDRSTEFACPAETIRGVSRGRQFPGGGLQRHLKAATNG